MRFSSHLSSRFIVSGVCVLVLALAAQAQVHHATVSTANSSAPSAQPIGPAQLITPEDLVKVIQSSGPKPLILNVGPSMLYMQAHIPGAEFIGPGSEPQGIQALKERVKNLKKTTSIVIYCGCCPWSHCPNVEPAYQQLRKMGFTRVKVLYIANNLGVDWVYKGYPTVR